jgi:hypothetical protein
MSLGLAFAVYTNYLAVHVRHMADRGQLLTCNGAARKDDGNKEHRVGKNTGPPGAIQSTPATRSFSTGLQQSTSQSITQPKFDPKQWQIDSQSI